MNRSTTIQEVRNLSPYKEGDVLQTKNGNKAVIMQVMLSVTHREIYYRLNWNTEGKKELVSLRVMNDVRVVNEMDRPYSWQ